MFLFEVKVAGNSLVKYNYDADYQPTSTVYGNSQTIYYTYDSQGQLTGISTAPDSVNRVSFTYDSQGNIVGINDYVNSRFTVVTYDDKNNATTTVYDSLEEGKKALHEYKTIDDVYTETVDGHTYSVTYSYDKDGRLTKAAYTIGNNTVSKELHYDDLDRTTAEVISAKIGETIKQILNTSFAYNDVMGFGTSNQVSVLQNKAEGYKNTIAYEYDANGYITKAGDVTYSYDEAGQLTRVNDPQYGTTVYVYDVGGNIKYVKTYDYTTGELGTCLNTVTYGYNNAWKDLLTNYNGQAITYDGSGNPLNYRDGMSFSWELGRQLKSLSVGGKTYSYKYNPDNLRTQKTDGTATTDFYWVNGQLTYQTDGTNDIYFLYDNNGSPIGFVLNETTYYYVKNLQGDIVAILDLNGNLMVEYTYDAWGKLLEISDYSGNNLGTINPLRYRGYYYDQETGLYYLQSRYYDPTVGRFINADDIDYLGIDRTGLSYNLFAYCMNNPVNYADHSGYFTISRSLVATLFDIGFAFINAWLTPIKTIAKKITGKALKNQIFKPIKTLLHKISGVTSKILNPIKKIVRIIPFFGKKWAKKIDVWHISRSIADSATSSALNNILDTIISDIHYYLSAGGIVSLILDKVSDGRINKKITI